MTPSSAASAVLAGLNDIRDEQEGLYRTLHQQPELSHQEHRTATMVSRWLERAGFQVHHGIGGDGVVGVLVLQAVRISAGMTPRMRVVRPTGPAFPKDAR